MRMKSVSFGFVTNSSTYVSIVLMNKNDLIEKLKNITSEEIKKIINENFEKFITKDLNIREREYYKKFLLEVEKSIYDVIKQIKNFAKSVKNTDTELLCIESSCDIDGNTIDILKPEAYALWFIIKYILKDNVVDSYTCYC